MVKTMSPLIWVIVLGLWRLVVGDYSCYCNYHVELAIYGEANVNTSPVGYMYEFDCFPATTLTTQLRQPWTAILYNHMVAYIRKDSSVNQQVCQGSIPYQLVLTTSTANPRSSKTSSVSSPGANNSASVSTTRITSTVRATRTTTQTTATTTTSPTTTPLTTTRFTTTVTTTPLPTTSSTTTPTITPTKRTTTPPITTSSATTRSTTLTTTLTPTTSSMTAPTTTPSTTTKPTTTPPTTTSSANTRSTRPTTTLTPTTSSMTAPTTTPSTTTKTTTTIPTTTSVQGNTALCPPHISGILAQHGASCFELVDRKGSWEHAEADCQSKGGHLFHVLNSQQQAYIINFMITSNFQNHAVWMGLHDLLHEEHFQWTSGDPVTYTNWVPGRKGNINTHDNEDCGLLIPYLRHGNWDDINCGTSNFIHDSGNVYPWICQYGLNAKPRHVAGLVGR